MIKADNQGNLYIFSDNSGYFVIKDLPKTVGKLTVVFYGEETIQKDFDVDGSSDVMVKLSKQDIESIGIGKHLYEVNLVSGEDVDTLAYNTITVMEKEERW